MSFGRDTALRAGAGLVAAGFAWLAIGFATFGLYTLMVPVFGVPGAAFATAGLCALLTGVSFLVVLKRAPTPVAYIAPPVASGQNTHLILALQELTQDHPLLSVCAAAILGAVGATDSRGR